MDKQKRTGMILRIEKSSIHDGEGLRTVVFFKGCPLRCKWCSTPESQTMECEQGYGRKMTVSEVMAEVVKDEIFFFHSGGGVTLSGGEVLMQAEFAGDVLKECCRQGIHTAIETSLSVDYQKLAGLLPYLNDIYVDIKHMADEAHIKYTGISNQRILENLRRLSDDSFPVNIHVRIPCIPSVNIDKDNIDQVGRFCTELTRLTEIELLPYHRLGRDTYNKLGIKYELDHVKAPEKEKLIQVAELLKSRLDNVKIRIHGEIL